MKNLLPFGPSDWSRTSGLVVPNHALYQLSYTRIFDFVLVWVRYGSGMGQGRLTHIVTHTILTSFSTFSRGKIEKCDLFKEIKNETVAYSVLPKQARYQLRNTPI